MASRKGTKELLRALLIFIAIESPPWGVSPCHAAEVGFEPKSTPTKAEWQHFHKMSDAQLAKLWSYQTGRGNKSLSDWSWQWRMGWLQRCVTQSLGVICQPILLTGLKDDAMVVRAEAAMRIGDRFAGKSSSTLIDAMTAAYKDPRNTRNGSPLFVCDRILEALGKIGGKRASSVAARLAKAYPETKEYWAKINRH